MVTNDVINKITSGKTFEHCIESDEPDYFPERLARAAQSSDVPEWVRKAANRILDIAMRQNISVNKVSFEEAGLGLHENIVERAVCGTEEERFYKIVMNFEEAIKRMKGV